MGKVKECFGHYAGQLKVGRGCAACASVDRCMEAKALSLVLTISQRAIELIQQEEEDLKNEQSNGKTQTK